MNRRRRSMLLGLSAMTLSGVAACERQARTEAPAAETQMAVYSSKEDCANSTEWTACQTAFDKAKVEHEQTAPKFASRADCEEKFDPSMCEERRGSNGGSFFMPMMMGMMMGQMMSGPRGYPVYADRTGAAYSGSTRVADPDPSRRPFAGGGAGGGGAGAAGLPRTINAPVAADGSIASRSSSATAGKTTRGGFGRTSAYRGSAGS